MKRFNIIGLLFIMTVIFANNNVGAANTTAKSKKQLTAKKSTSDFRDTFDVKKQNLSPTGENKYFILIPGFKQIFKDKDIIDTLTVLDETTTIDGVAVRVVADKEEKNGQPIEVTRDYYAIDTVTKDVYYFGEDVENYKDGKLVGTSGAWLSGIKGAKFGLMMPGNIKVGDKFYQELAPDVGMDRAEITQVGLTVVTPAGTFKHCIKMVETSAIEKDVKEYKIYAPGVGTVDDDGMKLIKIEKPKK